MATMLDLIKARQQGIFGITPEQLEAQRQKEQRKTVMQQIEQAAPRSPTPAMTSLGIAIGAGLGQGLLSRFGGQDLEMQQAQQAEESYNMLEEQVRATEASDLASKARVAAFREKLNSATTEEEFNRLALIASSTPELVNMVTPILNVTKRMFPEQKGQDIQYERIGTINIGTPDNPTYRQGVYSDKLGYGGYIGDDGELVRVSPEKLTQETGFEATEITSPEMWEIEINGEKQLRQTFFDKGSEPPTRYYVEDGKAIPIPVGAKKHYTSLESKSIPTFDQFRQIRTDLEEAKTGIRSLSNYLTTRGGASQGFGLLADQFITMFKTLVDGGKLTEEEFNTSVAEGQFQGIIGQVRVETVGGGVMTEQDAIRIMKRLGGFGALSNPEVVAAQIKSILVSKAETYQNRAAEYNYALDADDKYRKNFKSEDVDTFNKKYLESILKPEGSSKETTQNIQDLISQGYTSTKTFNGKTYMLNPTTEEFVEVK